MYSEETFYETLCRKKTCSDDDVEAGKQKLNRVLNVFDLIILGIGATLGCGVYILAGTVAKSIAGPAVVLSFLVAAIVSSFSGICYAEFVGRVPKAGSAYIYSYVTVGEFVAFIIGWTLYIEHSIGTASAAKAMTNYLDALLGYPQKRYMKSHFPMHFSFLGEYPDVASFLLVVFVAGIVAWGVRKSSSINNVFTVLNLLTICTVLISGFYFTDFGNWFIPKTEIPVGVDGGDGGFLPFGWTGVIAGAARCFYGFIGFDSLATTGEEAKNPKKTIPLAIAISLFLVTCAYSGVAAVLTLMWPYYDQDPNAPLPVIYTRLGMPVIKYMVSCGAVCALFTCLLGCLFPLPRILYAMSSDGLLFECLSTIHEGTQTPLLATVVGGLVCSVLSGVFNLEQLVEMTSIGTLVTYMIVSVCVLVLRYRNNDAGKRDVMDGHGEGLHKWFRISKTNKPNDGTDYASKVLIFIYTVAAIVCCVCVVNVDRFDGHYKPALTMVVYITVGAMIVTTLALCKLPQAVESLPFKVPLVPLIPCLSIFLNLYLMMELNIKTWIRFAVGIFLGMLIYAFYGARNSLEGVKRRSAKDEHRI